MAYSTRLETACAEIESAQDAVQRLIVGIVRCPAVTLLMNATARSNSLGVFRSVVARLGWFSVGKKGFCDE
jgi:hypothetical protein